MQRGTVCFQNTFSFRTRCECTSQTFHKCWCTRELNIYAAVCLVAIPLLLILFYVSLKLCIKFPFCPMYQLEMSARLLQKKAAHDIKS